MSLYRTDRERRILGDRVVARKEDFAAIHEGVQFVLDPFIASHKGLQLIADQRKQAEDEAQVALAKRDETAALGLRYYSWAHGQLAARLDSSWDDDVAAEDVALVRERIFPLGSPSEVAESPQLIQDGLGHLLTTMKRETAVRFPDDFVAAVGQTHEGLVADNAGATQERADVTAITAEHKEARERWDDHYASLRDICGAFLRLDGQYDRLTSLFAPLPKRSGQTAETVETAEPTVVEEAEA